MTDLHSAWIEFLAAVLPLLLQLLGAVVGVVLLRLSVVAKKRWNIEIDAGHRDAIQTAFMNGAKSAVSKGLRGDAAIQAAIAHVAQSTPDALKHFRSSAETLAGIGESKVDDALREKFQVTINNGAVPESGIVRSQVRR